MCCCLFLFVCFPLSPPFDAVECASSITPIVMLMDTRWLCSQYISTPGDLIYLISSAEVSQFVALVVSLQSRNPGSSWQKRNREVLLSGEAIINQVCSSIVATKKKKKKSQSYLVAVSRVPFLPLPPPAGS